MVCVRFLGCGGSERFVQRWNSPYLEIHSSEGALHKSKNSLALDDLRFSKKLNDTIYLMVRNCTQRLFTIVFTDIVKLVGSPLGKMVSKPKIQDR